MITFPSLNGSISKSNFDANALAYIKAVETADGGLSLEPEVITAINNFVKGCKTDGIWAGMQSCCIMAGARTIAGALVPLKGPSPTNVGLSTYSRKIGIQGGATKYLNTNTTNTIDAGNLSNVHAAIFTVGTIGAGYAMGGISSNADIALRPYNANGIFRAHNNNGTLNTTAGIAGLAGVTRNSSTQFNAWYNTAGGLNTTTITDPLNGANVVNNAGVAINIYIFDRNGNTTIPYTQYIGFYSIGTYINLTLLNNRLITLFSVFNNIV
jgi:hypothetical protein